MLKLMKYEFRKTAFSKLILLSITLLSEIVYLLGIFLKKDMFLSSGIMFLVLCATMGILYIGLESVTVLHRDLNTKQSYMLFLTPKSSYQILGAKILENGISILITGAFFAALAAIDAAAAYFYVGGLKEVWNMVNDVLYVSMHISVDPVSIAFAFFTLLASWISYIVSADFAVILSASVLAGKKASGVVSFVIFIILSTLLGMVLDRVPTLQSKESTFALYIAVVLVISAIIYLISGWIMEKKLSV